MVCWQPYMVLLVSLVLLIYVVSTVSISAACVSSLVGAWSDYVYFCKCVVGDVCSMCINWAT